MINTKNLLTNILYHSISVCFIFNNAYLRNYSNKPLISYLNANAQKKDILMENKNKTSIYRWTNVESGKSYVGSAISLSKRLKNYYNISYLEREILSSNSMIYKALLKYGYSKFKLDILEICDYTNLIEREQYYLDLLKPEYNILKTAGSLKGFIHNEATIELMRAVKLGQSRSDAAKLAIADASLKAQCVLVINNKTDENTEFTSIRKAAEFIGLHHSYIAKCIKSKNIYKGKDYTIVKK